MNFQQRIAAHAVGVLSTRDLPQTASIAIEEGYESASLQQLARHSNAMHPLQPDETYLQGLKDLGLFVPSAKIATALLLHYYVRRIVYEQLDIAEGFTLVHELMNRVNCTYAELALQDAYTHYCTINEYNSPQFEPDDAAGLSRDAAIAQQKQLLFEILQNWLNQHRLASDSDNSLVAIQSSKCIAS